MLSLWGSGRLDVNGGRVAVGQVFFLFVRPVAFAAGGAGLQKRATNAGGSLEK